MYFELNTEIVDQIIFAMENQSGEFRFDTKTRLIVSLGEIEDPSGEEGPEEEDGSGRYVEIPEWNSFLGFQLMERFVGTLNNPVYRSALTEALQSGRGVFRNFKNVLKEKREIERLWFQFKEKEMRREVAEWYECLRESWGLEELETDLEAVEETEGLVLEDFTLSTDTVGREWILKEFDRQGFLETHAEYGRERALTAYAGERALVPPLESPASVITAAENPAGDIVGFVWGVEESGGRGRIVQLYVVPEMRGLGIASVLLEAELTALAEGGIEEVTFALSGPGMGFARHCERQGFRIVRYDMALDLEEWDPFGNG